MHRFTIELSSVNSIFEDSVLCLLIARVKMKTKFWNEVQETYCHSLSAFYMMVKKHLHKEASIKKLNNPVTMGDMSSNKEGKRV